MRVAAAGAFLELLRQRVAVLDGAMGTMIQRRRLSERNCDLLCITQPRIVAEIHRQYLAAGADVISTNTFNGTVISQAEFGEPSRVSELNETAARLARTVADEVAAASGIRRFVAGVLGPTGRSVSRSSDANDPSFRHIGFDELAAAYAQASLALIRGGVDVLLIETVFDLRNAEAALSAARDVMKDCGVELPIIVSAALSDAGRTQSGHSPEDFWNAIRGARPAVVGFNCMSAAQLPRPRLEELSRAADCAVCIYPSAGLPNAAGIYDDAPELIAEHVREFAGAGLLNMVGGCCGTTPDHIQAMANAVTGLAPRPYHGAGL